MRMKVSNYISEMLVKAWIRPGDLWLQAAVPCIWMMHWDTRKAFTVSMITMSRPAPLQQRHMPGSIMRWQLSA